MDIRRFLIEKKNQRLFILGVIFLVVFIIAIILLILVLGKSQKKQTKEINSKIVLPTPTKTSNQTTEETIQSLGYSIDCQLVVTTSLKKIFVKKLSQCNNVLDYKLSPSKKYATYLFTDKNKTTQLFVYSLDNNIDGQLQVISQPIIMYQFDSRNNIVMLFSNKFDYYFVPLLFSGYPGNYYKELNTFTDIEKRKIETSLPETKTPYAKILEQEQGISLTDAAGVILYSIGFNDLEGSLSPTPPPVIDRRLLNWDKRIFFFSGKTFKTMDIDGSNELTHQFICDGIEVVPIAFQNSFMIRSPDGQTLAFLVPTDAQMRENPNWKDDIFVGKNIFDRGELVFYDLVKGDCQKVGIPQSALFRETFSFSPDGQYIAFVDKGVSLYNLRDHQDYQLAIHNPDRENDGTAITGPLVWNGASRFIYTLVSKINNGTIISTNLVRIYFDEKFNGVEQTIIPLINDSLYAVSSDGSKILYTKDSQVYKYDVDRKVNSLFSKGPIDKINKLIWLRDGTIVSNMWIANENLYFTKIPEMQSFHINFDQDVIVYNSVIETLPNSIFLYDLTLKRQKFFKDKQTKQGEVLRLYY